jgi:lysophospholipase L1-like esterase
LWLTAGALAILPLLEVGLRCGGFWYPPADEGLSIWNSAEDRSLLFGTGMFASAPRELWVPQPGARVVWGTNETINAGGYRGPQRERAHASDVLRIVVLGESATFGYGIGYDESFCSRLEEILRASGRKVEVIDAGVVGYTIVQGLERYRAFAKAYDPDVVVEAFGAVNEHLLASGPSDLEKVEMPLVESGRWTEIVKLAQLHLRSVQLLAELSDRTSPTRMEERALALVRIRNEIELRTHMGELDWKGRRRVSPDEFERTLLALRDEVRADGGELVALSMPRRRVSEAESPVLAAYTDRLVEVSSREGIPLAEGWRAFRDADDSGARESQLYLDAWHPSAAGHRLLAEALAARIRAISAAR